MYSVSHCLGLSLALSVVVGCEPSSRRSRSTLSSLPVQLDDPATDAAVTTNILDPPPVQLNHMGLRTGVYAGRMLTRTFNYEQLLLDLPADSSLDDTALEIAKRTLPDLLEPIRLLSRESLLLDTKLSPDSWTEMGTLQRFEATLPPPDTSMQLIVAFVTDRAIVFWADPVRVTLGRMGGGTHTAYLQTGEQVSSGTVVLAGKADLPVNIIRFESPPREYQTTEMMITHPGRKPRAYDRLHITLTNISLTATQERVAALGRCSDGQSFTSLPGVLEVMHHIAQADFQGDVKRYAAYVEQQLGWKK